MTNSEHSSDLAETRCVLVVDDHDQVRHLLHVALETAGFDVAEAGTQLDAQRRLAHIRPDAVVLNLQHAETDGLVLLTHMRARQDLDEVPIVFLAGRHQDDLRWQAARAGADWFAERPLSMLELQARIRTLLRSGRRVTSSRLRRTG